MCRAENEQGRGTRHSRQKLRVRLEPGVAHRGFIGILHQGWFALHQQFGRGAGGAQVLVVCDIFPEVAEIVARKRCSIRPLMPLAKLQRIYPVFLDVHAFQYVGCHLQIPVIANQPRVAVHHQHAHIARASYQHIQRPTMLTSLAGLAVHDDHQRVVRQALLDRRQLFRIHVFLEHRRLKQLGGCRGPKRRQAHQQRGGESQRANANQRRLQYILLGHVPSSEASTSA